MTLRGASLPEKLRTPYTTTTPIVAYVTPEVGGAKLTPPTFYFLVLISEHAVRGARDRRQAPLRRPEGTTGAPRRASLWLSPKLSFVVVGVLSEIAYFGTTCARRATRAT